MTTTNRRTVAEQYHDGNRPGGLRELRGRANVFAGRRQDTGFAGLYAGGLGM